MLPIKDFQELQAIAKVPDSYRDMLGCDEITYRPDMVLAFLRVWGATSEDSGVIKVLVNSLVQSPDFDIHNTLAVEALLSDRKTPKNWHSRHYFGVDTKQELAYKYYS